MPFFQDLFEHIRDFFTGGNDEDDGITLDPEDWETHYEDPELEEEAESLLMDEEMGESTGLFVDWETGVEYCSGAPDGILRMVLINPEDDPEDYEYEIFRVYDEAEAA